MAALACARRRRQATCFFLFCLCDKFNHKHTHTRTLWQRGEHNQNGTSNSLSCAKETQDEVTTFVPACVCVCVRVCLCASVCGVKNYSKAATFFVSSSFLVGFFGCFCLSNCPIYLGVGERKKKKVGGESKKER